jgi:hypothetical protein
MKIQKEIRQRINATNTQFNNLIGDIETGTEFLKALDWEY